MPRRPCGPLALADLEGRDFATIAEYASITRCDPRTVAADIKAGSIPFIKAGREFRIPVEFIRAVATPQEWARREAAKIPPMTAGQVRQMALEARRADALHVLDGQPADADGAT